MAETFGAQNEQESAKQSLWEGDVLSNVVRNGTINKFHANLILDQYFYVYKSAQTLSSKPPKNVGTSPLASNAAGFSVAVSNDKDVGDLYLSNPEVSNAGD